MNREYSFYYREMLDLKKLYPNAERFSLLYPDPENNLIIEDGIISLREPERFNPSRIDNIVKVYPHKYDYFKINVKIRCWQEDKYQLKEITNFRVIKLLKASALFRKVLNKFRLRRFNTHLCTRDGVSYFLYNNRLLKIENCIRTCIGKMPRLLHPIYYEFLPVGNEAFFRTMNRIYRSSGGMKQWQLIYEGKRAIKNSMVWIDAENALLFTEYTPGLVLSRHFIFKYYVNDGSLKKVLTFCTPEEHEKDDKLLYCRHIHVIMRDPYTGNIYLGVGDSDDESAIYRSSDNGNTFSVIGRGNQNWRTLSFFFTKKYIYWNTDSPDPQFINRINRSQLDNLPIPSEKVQHFPIYNGANWNSDYDTENDLYIMSSSCEGGLYDQSSRILGVKLDDNKPLIYNLFTDNIQVNDSSCKYQQLFVLGKDNTHIYWFYDLRKSCYRRFVMKRRK